MKKVKIGIIGVGNMGTTHARNIVNGKVAGLELTALCDSDPERMKSFEGIKQFTDPQELIGCEAVEAVLIATPHFSHTTLGSATLQAGKHLLVEKPISVHKADCQRLIEAHTDENVIFSAMFNQRTNPNYIKIRDMVKKGELGEIRRVVWIITDWFRTENYYASGGWRATWRGEGGGVLLNQCPHQLDLWQWIFGMPKKLRAFCEIGRYHPIEVEDDVTCYMEYENGCKGVFITTTGEAPGTNRLEITGERGNLVYDMSRESGIEFIRNEVGMSEWSAECEGGFTAPPVWNVKIPVAGGEGNGPQHIGIMENFAEAILHAKPLLAPANEGIHSVELGNAMLYSSMTEQTLELPLDAVEYEKLLKKKIAESTFKKKVVDNKIAADFK